MCSVASFESASFSSITVGGFTINESSLKTLEGLAQAQHGITNSSLNLITALVHELDDTKIKLALSVDILDSRNILAYVAVLLAALSLASNVILLLRVDPVRFLAGSSGRRKRHRKHLGEAYQEVIDRENEQSELNDAEPQLSSDWKLSSIQEKIEGGEVLPSDWKLSSIQEEVEGEEVSPRLLQEHAKPPRAVVLSYISPLPSIGNVCRL